MTQDAAEGSDCTAVTGAPMWADGDLAASLTVTIADNDAAPPSDGGGGDSGSSDLALLALLAGVLLARATWQRRR